MTLITNTQRQQLLVNDRKTLLSVFHDPLPVVKLHSGCELHVAYHRT
ncbi:hypothetical protein [Tardibacter chloracetimidivorans]